MSPEETREKKAREKENELLIRHESGVKDVSIVV